MPTSINDGICEYEEKSATANVQLEISSDAGNSSSEDCAAETSMKNVPSEENDKKNSYISRKPRWWKRLAGRRGTAKQRKAIGRMTQQGYVLPKLCKYQHELNLCKIFEEAPRGKAICPNEVLVPKSKYESGTLHSNAENIAKSKRVSLEIGFGLGDNILTNATKFPDRYYIGAEIHQPGVGVALMRMEKAIDTGTYWLEQDWLDESNLVDIEERQATRDPDCPVKPYDNLRIFPGDGIKLLGFLPDNSLDSIYLTFPDPWPDDQQHQWRVIQEETVHMIGRKLRPGGRFYLATDALSFDEWTQNIFATVHDKNMKDNGSGSDSLTRWEELIPCPDRSLWLSAMSKYETKGIEEGRYTVCRGWECNKPP